MSRPGGDLPTGESLSQSLFAGLLRDKRLGALIVGKELAGEPQIVALARAGHSIIVICGSDLPPGIVSSSPDRLARDVLNASGAGSGAD